LKVLGVVLQIILNQHLAQPERKERGGAAAHKQMTTRERKREGGKQERERQRKQATHRQRAKKERGRERGRVCVSKCVCVHVCERE